MTDADKLSIAKALLSLFAERYVHVDEAQALHDCKYHRDEYVAAYTAIMSVFYNDASEAVIKSYQKIESDNIAS